MMKSLVTNAQAVLAGLFLDVQSAFPTVSGLDRDYRRLLALMQNRGLESLMLDLPNLDDLLLQGLETGRLVLEGPLSKRVSNRVLVPRLFAGLWQRIFSADGCLMDDPCINAILFIRQLCCMFKKLELKCSVDRESKAVEEYYEIEGTLRDPDLLWSDSEFDTFDRLNSLHFRDGLWDDHILDFGKPEVEKLRVELLVHRLQRLCDSVAGELGFFDPYEFTNLVGRGDTSSRYMSHGRGSAWMVGASAVCLS